jgi:hypothetical protein
MLTKKSLHGGAIREIKLTGLGQASREEGKKAIIKRSCDEVRDIL